MSAKRYLLDTSVLIDYAREVEKGLDGPATRTLSKLPAGRVFVSPVTIAELLEGAVNGKAAARFLYGYKQTTIGAATAKCCALNQSRMKKRMGENDAWQAALALTGEMTLVGSDAAFARLPALDYHDHRKG